MEKKVISNTITIRPKKSILKIDWREFWQTKELFYYLTWRDIKVRYKQTVLGILWIVIRPLFSMVIFTIVFGNFSKIPSDNIPYPIFVFIGLLFWNFFSQTLSSASNSLISDSNIIKKIYFPRIMSPISSTFSFMVDLIPTFVILAGLLIYYKVPPTFEMFLLLPLLLILILLTSLGLGFFLAPINARFRDIRHILPHMIQLGMYLTPVIYPTSLFGGSMKQIRIFNPVAEAIEVSRSVFFHTRPFDLNTFLLSFTFALFLFITGFLYFRSKEDNLVDIL